jgi:hypothetical protein
MKACKMFLHLQDLHLHTQTHIKKTSLEINLNSSKEIHCIFKTHCIISALFSTKTFIS